MAILTRKKKADTAQEDKAVTTAETAAPKLKENTGDAYKVLVKPLLTEKTNRQLAQSKLVFRISDSANKISVRKAVEAVYDVKVKNVNIVMVRGKKRVHGRERRMGADWKKAVVTLRQQGDAVAAQGAN
jgi:large subunit ribosomal protein L23